MPETLLAGICKRKWTRYGEFEGVFFMIKPGYKTDSSPKIDAQLPSKDAKGKGAQILLITTKTKAQILTKSSLDLSAMLSCCRAD